jgi:adenosylhomocysteine nucleosidase
LFSFKHDTDPIMQTLIIFPLPEERQHFAAALSLSGAAVRASATDILHVPDLDAALVLGGHGKTQFGIQTFHAISAHPLCRRVICAGAAGGLRPGLKLGDIIYGLQTLEHDYTLRFVSRPHPRFEAAPALAAVAKAQAGKQQSCGLILSGDEDIVDHARAQSLRDSFGADCVAWEGAGGARAAKFAGKDFIEVRAITDSADADAPTSFEESLPLAMASLAQSLSAFVLKLAKP